MYIRINIREKGTLYYELLVFYVDDVLAVSHLPEIIMKSIGLAFDIKDNNYGPSTTYLGSNA